jgi:cytochrome c-type biogenesis protein CcmH/NrfF
MRVELAGLVASGMNADQVVKYYVDKYGSEEVLAAPINRGFNQLLWALPYAVGAVGIVVIGGLAIRWSRRRAAQQPAAITAADPELERRLDDELRDLD